MAVDRLRALAQTAVIRQLVLNYETKPAMMVGKAATRCNRKGMVIRQ